MEWYENSAMETNGTCCVLTIRSGFVCSKQAGNGIRSWAARYQDTSQCRESVTVGANQENIAALGQQMSQHMRVSLLLSPVRKKWKTGQSNLNVAKQLTIVCLLVCLL